MPSSRRLLFLSESVGFGPARTPGGGELFAKEFLMELARRGWNITIVAPPEGPLFRDASLAKCTTRYPLDLSTKITDWRFLYTVWRWAWFSYRFRGQLIYGNGYVTMKWLVLARVLWKATVFCHLHESSYEAYLSWRARFLSPLVHRFIAISDAVRDLFIRGTRVSPEKVLRVHNGVAVPKTLPAPDPIMCEKIRKEFHVAAANRLVVMLARTERLKGHEVLLRAVNLVRRSIPDITFLIAGLEATRPDEVKLYNHLQLVIDEEGIRDSIRQVGFRSDGRILMRCADVVVVPSTQEGFGRTAIEAMAEGTPIIASATGGLKEIIRDGVDGRLFPPADHAALAQQIVNTLLATNSAEKIAANGYETACSKFSTEAMTDLIEAQLMEANG